MANTFKFGNEKWAVGKETVLAYNDENNNFKPLPFTFDRGSIATVVNSDGLIETVGVDEPRIDFLNNTKGHLLLEPQRTNLYLNSEPTSNEGSAFGISYESFDWSLGFTNCVKFGDNSTTRYRYGSSVSSSTEYTISAFVIMDDLSEPVLGTNSATGDFSFVLSNELATTINSNVNLGNNVYKVSATHTASQASTNNGIVKYTTQSSKGFRVVGWQIEAGSYATSYIPTSGSAVTRSAENAFQQNVTQVIGQSEGTMYIEFVPKDTLTPIQILYQIRSSSGTIGQTDIRLQGGNIRALANDGGSNQFNIDGGSYTAGTTYKVAIRYKLNDSKLYINGSSVGSDTSCSFTGSSLDQISFAENLSSLLPVADILDARLYDTGLSDSELQALTS